MHWEVSELKNLPYGWWCCTELNDVSYSCTDDRSQNQKLFWVFKVNVYRVYSRACNRMCDTWQWVSMEVGMRFFPRASKLLQRFCWIQFLCGTNFRTPQRLIKMLEGGRNGFRFVLIKLQWHCVVYSHSAERDKSKVMQLSPPDSFLQAVHRTAEQWKNISHFISTWHWLIVQNCLSVTWLHCCCLVQPSEKDCLERQI